MLFYISAWTTDDALDVYFTPYVVLLCTDREGEGGGDALILHAISGTKGGCFFVFVFQRAVRSMMSAETHCSKQKVCFSGSELRLLVGGRNKTWAKKINGMDKEQKKSREQRDN